MKSITHCYLGVDPGKAGGVSYIITNGSCSQRVCAVKMPSTDKDVYDLFRGIYQLADTVECILESVHSSPQMGVKSAFTFGRGYGAVKMALVACHIVVEDVTPQRWQRALGCLSKGDKNVTKARAQQLFPHLKVTHNVADSLLLAEYCRRTRT